jgi:transposase
MLVAIAAAAAAAGGRRAGGALMRLPSQWFLVVEAIDLRCGMDRLLVWVQQSGGATTGSVGYVFRNRSGSRIKLLLVDATGVWLCVRRLHSGGFHWPRSEDPKCTLSSEQFEWLCAGVDWMRLSTSVIPEHTF